MKQLPLYNHAFIHAETGFKDWLDILGYAPITVYNLPHAVSEFLHWLEGKEYTTGRGQEVRTFKVGVHPFANAVAQGRVLKEILTKFHEKLEKDGYDFLKLDDSKSYKIPLGFSPSINPLSWLESLRKHVDSNPSQFFIGGSIATVSIKDKNMIVMIYNETSRNSLMLHLAANYNRKDGNIPLSTIKQYIIGSFPISW